MLNKFIMEQNKIDALGATLVAKSATSNKVTDIQRLLEGAVGVKSAWQIEGNNPEYHRAMKAKLYREWPTLAVAIETLAAIK